MLHDNPAERLRVILERGRAISGDQPCRSVWEQLLSVKPGESDELYAKLGKVMALPRETMVLLKTNFPRQVAGAEFWRAQVDAGFTNQNLAGQWATFIGQINAYSITQLGLTADLIQQRVATALVPDQDLERVLKEIHELIAAVDQSDLGTSLKNYLARELAELQQALRDYMVSGAVPILKQAESMVGHVLVDPEYKSFLTNHDLGKRLLDNLNAAAAVLTVALQLPQIGPAFTQLLLRSS
jgi:hypothetical protein